VDGRSPDCDFGKVRLTPTMESRYGIVPDCASYLNGMRGLCSAFGSPNYRPRMNKDRRPRYNVIKNATQNPAAMLAVIMKLRGDTSHEVSEMILPNAKQLKASASCRSDLYPQR
jgi:hypothetical protein